MVTNDLAKEVSFIFYSWYILKIQDKEALEFHDPHNEQGPGLLIPDPAKEKDCKAYEKTYWQVQSHHDHHTYAQRCKKTADVATISVLFLPSHC